MANTTIENSGGILEIDLDAIAANYRTLRDRAGKAECAAVVKADAYGLGAEKVVPALAASGCRTFFVALPGEAEAVRSLSASARIFVLNGLFPGCAPDIERIGAIPVLGSREEIREWCEHCRSAGKRLPGALHVDTGINRIGIAARELAEVAIDMPAWAFEPVLLMSHLACADDPDDAMNARQLSSFRAASDLLPGVQRSLCNSAGIFLGQDYHHDIVRAGISLYGGAASRNAESRLKPVVRLLGKVAQVRTVEERESVGYGATWTAHRRSSLAIVTAGYADGYFRVSGSGRFETAFAALDGQRLPVVGRISMDMLAVDITDYRGSPPERGSFLELLGETILIDDFAASSGTIGYEVLTNLGSRYVRVYSGA